MAQQDDTWLQESVIEFLRGPCYTNPLMGFIDEKCAVFDTEEENKLEYTQIHHEFQEVVDELISDFLEELGVSAEQFADTVASNVANEKLNSFVLSSILTVEDFVQFKAMMVKRNIDLTNQVLAIMEEHQLEEVLAQQREWEEEIREQFGTSGSSFAVDAELAKAMRESALGDGAEYDDEFRKALAMSMKQQSALDLERAELEQALALSLALEQEHKKQHIESIGEATEPTRTTPAAPPSVPAPPAMAAPSPSLPTPAAAAPAAPAAPAVASPKSVVTAAPKPAAADTSAAAPLGAIKPKAMASGYTDGGSSAAFTPPATTPASHLGLGLPSPDSLPAVGASGAPASPSLRGNVGAGYMSSKGAVDHAAIRAAAEEAAKAQKDMLLQRRSSLQKKAEDLAQTTGQVSEIERQRREAYLKQQREHLLLIQKKKRELEMEEYLEEHKKAPKPASVPATKDEIMDAKRAELRNSLAQQIKQQMIA
eukprot:CAMPEP_0177775466 /NCGR_PEP_ID=MMETSP0491_2-20121128/14133_1 /TAXON_ID=63592 /ORGANISM="Tetraselmis chuii, Strain PLY429" /LENGTH=481 /DNA_ID=CAMNT_0019294069 /DNA_START=352 /DNA_END=1794 /DNA_ORIENTATION=+